MNATTTSKPLAIDWLTVMAISAQAYVLSTALHEHGGHASACVALGGSVRAFGAFYVDCDYRAMGDAAIRLVAIAGPVASVLSGLIAARLLRSAQGLHFRFGFGALLSRAFCSGGGFLSFNRLFAALVFGACVLLSSLLGSGLGSRSLRSGFFSRGLCGLGSGFLLGCTQALSFALGNLLG